jgi:hypothetical protein
MTCRKVVVAAIPCSHEIGVSLPLSRDIVG